MGLAALREAASLGLLRSQFGSRDFGSVAEQARSLVPHDTVQAKLEALRAQSLEYLRESLSE